jgi:hypothetical protein
MHAHPVRPTITLCDSLAFLYARRILILVVISLPYRILDISYHLLIFIFLPIVAPLYRRFSRCASYEGQEDS